MITLNQQAPESRDYRDDGSLEIVGEPFYTLQGEGPFAGRPAVFVRLAGCNLQCPGCDTLYTGPDRRRLSVSDLVVECYAATARRIDLLVLTGGEPFRQNIGPFVKEMLFTGRQVQIETNGTIYPDDHEFPFASPNLTVVCSPKSPTVNGKMQRWVRALKYVLSADAVADDGLPLTTLGNSFGVCRPWPSFEGEVYVQPAEPSMRGHDGSEEDLLLATNEYLMRKLENQNAAVESCLKHGYRLSVQVHKIVGVK